MAQQVFKDLLIRAGKYNMIVEGSGKINHYNIMLMYVRTITMYSKKRMSIIRRYYNGIQFKKQNKKINNKNLVLKTHLTSFNTAIWNF